MKNQSKKTSCSQLKEIIPDLALGEIKITDLALPLQLHLRDCPHCKSQLEDSIKVWSRLELNPPPELSDQLDARILAGISRPSPVSRVRFPVWTAVAAAAAALIVLGGRYLFDPTRPETSSRRGVSVSALSREKAGMDKLDPDQVLKEYLVETEDLFAGLESGRYSTWRELNAVILSRDLQGRAAYLIDSFPSGSPPAELVKSSRILCGRLLSLGRGRENQPVKLPPEYDPGMIRTQVKDLLNSEKAGARP